MSNPNPSPSYPFTCGHGHSAYQVAVWNQATNTPAKPADGSAGTVCGKCAKSSARAHKAAALKAFRADRRPGCRCTKDQLFITLCDLCYSLTTATEREKMNRDYAAFLARLDSYSISSSIPGASPANLRARGIS